MINKTKKSVSFYTLGCRLNQSETAVIARTFEVDGYSVVDINEPADMVVINTCTVTENGDADTRRLVNKVNRINPHTRIALVGCQAQTQKEKLASLPNVYWIVGNDRKMDTVSILNELANIDKPQVIAPTISRESFTIPIAGIDKKHTRANIKIQDGCDFFCTFCEIPFARGRARSREFNDIIKECHALVEAGHKEIVVTGINVGTYDNQQKSIMDVITTMEAIDGLERIRISSIEPTTIPKELMSQMNGNSKLCRHLHIPLQSANDKVLIDMKRKYTYNEFKEFVTWAYNEVPNICIGTDVIVGYPTETEEAFNDTVAKLKELPIHYFHVFSYSKRHLAKSHHDLKEIPTEEIARRSKILRDISTRKRNVYYQSQQNKEHTVLFEQEKRGRWQGLTDNYIRIECLSNDPLSNQMRSVKLTTLNDHSLEGQLL